MIRSVLAVKTTLFLWAAVSIAASAFAAEETRGPQPSWFPKKACVGAPSGRNPFQYDHARDSKVKPGVGNLGYANYQKRVLSEAGLRRADCYKEWTVLVYMAADNDLHPYAMWDLYEMEGAFESGTYAGSTAKTDLLVQADTAGRTGVRRYHVFQRPGREYAPGKSKEAFEKMPLDQVQSPIVALAQEPAPTSPREHKDKLGNFLAWGMREYPALHYMVIVWGHGQGWAPEPARESRHGGRFVDAREIAFSAPTSRDGFTKAFASGPFTGRFGGIAFNEDGGDYLSIPGLSEVLAGASGSVLEGKRKIDVYASDACLMQMAEVAYEISDSARFIVGSSQITTYLGLPYRQMMYEINTGRFLGAGKNIKTGDEPFYVARMLPALVQRSLDPRRGHQGRADKASIETFTMSSLSAGDLRAYLVPALDILAQKLSAYAAEDAMRAMDLQYLIENTPSFMGGSRELGSFLGLLEMQLREEAELAQAGPTPGARHLMKAIEIARKALALTVVNHTYGTGYRLADRPLHVLGFKGLALWLPQSPQEFEGRIGDFRASHFYQTFKKEKGVGRWESWLSAIYAPAPSGAPGLFTPFN